MELKKIEELTYRWRSATWKVIECENPGLEEVRRLFKETYDILDTYSKAKIVPKEICGLLLEMHGFGWWVYDLNSNPLHEQYQEILTSIITLNKYILTRNANAEEIATFIENFYN